MEEYKTTISFGDKRESAHNLAEIQSTTKYLESNPATHVEIKLLILFDVSIPHLKIIL